MALDPQEKIRRRLARYSAAVEAVEKGEGPEWLAEAVALLRRGFTGSEIATHLGFQHSTVYARLSDPTGAAASARKRRYCGTCGDCGAPTSYQVGGTSRRCIDCEQSRNAERNAEIIARWNEGEPKWYIAEEMGLRGEQVRGCIQHARRLGKDVALHRKRNRSDWPEIERLYREGLTYREIGERIGDSEQGVYNKVNGMRKAGINLPPRRVAA